MSLLKVSGVTKQFGGLTAVDQVSFTVEKGELVSLMGPNGAGKTTLLNVISGVTKATGGQIFFKDQDITALESREKARLGMARTFQLTRIITSLTVLENVVAGYLYCMTDANSLSAFLRTKTAVAEENAAKERAFEALKLVGMESLCNRIAGSLSYGQRRLVEVARALVSSPSLILLDEPAAGLNTKETAAFGEMLKSIQARLNLSIILVEHEMALIMKVSDRVVVMNYGKKLTEGIPREIMGKQEVIEAYLGKGRDYAVS